VIIGNGTPDEAKHFRDTRAVPMPIYVDQRLRAYRAAGLRRGVASTLGLKAILNGLRAGKEGNTQGRTAGDPWQLGGVFVIRPDGETIFEQRSDAAGDHADPAAVLAALAGNTPRPASEA
jgi:hypothetical protein